MNQEEAKTKAAEATRVLNEPLLKEAFSNVEAALQQALRQVKTEQEAFKAAIACQVFDLIRSQLEAHVETAKIMSFNTQKGFLDRVLGR
jgi:hypothetical protein